jgi:hypothetical protein
MAYTSVALEQSSITYKFRSFKMKKQLLIAAIAATMSVSAMADMSPQHLYAYVCVLPWSRWQWRWPGG